jgi:monovalent cation/proton antiporter MnhG/PhaG subunit
MDVVRVVLLIVGVGTALISCIGLFAVRGVFDRLHLTAPASTIAPASFALAIVLDEPLFSASGIKAVLVAVVVIALNPVLVHATARAAIVREHGSWQLPDEVREAGEEPAS